MRLERLLWPAAGLLLGLGAGACWERTHEVPAVTAGREALADDRLRSEEAWVVEVFEEAAPWVVHIFNIGVEGTLFSMREVQQGTGSGFVWDAEGHVVTNFHVIQGAQRIAVRLLGEKAGYPAQVVGVEPRKDLAVLKIEAPRGALKPIRVGDSSALRVGQAALAIGNPFGLDHSLSKGVISALGREMPGPTGLTITDVIQTDALINPGNSGGPLLNSRGELIGVNTQIVTPTGQSVRVGFAVPASTVQHVVGQILRYGEVKHPGLGIQIFPDAAIRSWGLPAGVPILSVGKGSAAERAGLKGATVYRDGSVELADIIVAIDDLKITGAYSLQDALNRYRVGDVVEVTVLRDGSPHRVEVRLQAID